MAIVSATEGNSNQKIVSEQKVTEFKKKKKSNIWMSVHKRDVLHIRYL